MRIFLQQISSGRFLAEDGQWTEDEAEAKEFSHFLEAMVFARDHLEGPVGAYCAFQEPSYNFSVFLRGAAAARQWEAKVKSIQHLRETRKRAHPGVEC